jgi:cyclin-C
LGEQLRLRQQVIASATIYFRRFYSKYSLKCIDPFLLAPTCLFLATKVEEFGLQSHRFATTAATLVKSKYSHIYTQEYPYKIQHIWECEFYLLEVMVNIKILLKKI